MSITRNQPQQIATSNLDWQKAIVGKPEGVWMPPYVTAPKEKRTKFDTRLVRCRFIVYSDHSGRVLVSRDAQFMEDVFDGGRRNDVLDEVPIALEDDDEVTDESSQ